MPNRSLFPTSTLGAKQCLAGRLAEQEPAFLRPAASEVRDFVATTEHECSGSGRSGQRPLARAQLTQPMTSSTASASELTGNAFIPYLGNNLALVGSNTYGKPVGQIARDRATCDDRLRVMAFRTVNADGGGDYYTGLASVFPNTCAADDDFLHQFGTKDEDSTATALSFLRGGTCTPISASGAQRAASRQRIEALSPARPTAAQYQIPGLY